MDTACHVFVRARGPAVHLNEYEPGGQRLATPHGGAALIVSRFKVSAVKRKEYDGQLCVGTSSNRVSGGSRVPRGNWTIPSETLAKIIRTRLLFNDRSPKSV